jgi:hypothetical protein
MKPSARLSCEHCGETGFVTCGECHIGILVAVPEPSEFNRLTVGFTLGLIVGIIVIGIAWIT